MSKGIYRSVNVEGVVSAALVALLKTATVIVGLDVAKFDLAAAFALGTGEVVQIVRFNQLTQTHLFLDLIGALRRAGREVQIAMEPTGTYGDALREMLHGAGAAIFMVPAKHVHDARELYDNVPSKHDPKDAVTLARLRSQGDGSLWKPVDPFRRDVRALIETREVHHGPLMQGYNRLEALLARHWPEVSSLVNVYETTSLWKLLVEMPGPHEIAARPQEARELLSKQSRRTLKAAAIEAIITCARDTMGVAPTRLERAQMQRVVSEMLRHREEVRAVDRELRALLESRPEFGAMVRWVGLVTTGVLLGCVGDPLDFHHAGAYEKACGLNLKEQSSGTATRRGLHITHRGSACARKYLYLFVLRWKARDRAACAWVERRQSWPRKGGKVSALVALMRKAVGALWHLRRGQDYEAGRLFDLRRLTLTPPAQATLITESDAGEAEALALARAQGLPLLADEKKGRSIARMMKIPVLGLVGVLLLAVERGILEPQAAGTLLQESIN
ncbi:MAG TPA: IS110 family transposase, partial [Thauera aminoaromatica]|nr:IS110 family transposase [Thauera aminoaromatica]